MVPVCMVYGTWKTESPTVPAAGAAAGGLRMLFTAAGPAVPETSANPFCTAALNCPVMPERVKRLEKFITVPPGATPIVRRK